VLPLLVLVRSDVFFLFVLFQRGAERLLFFSFSPVIPPTLVYYRKIS